MALYWSLLVALAVILIKFYGVLNSESLFILYTKFLGGLFESFLFKRAKFPSAAIAVAAACRASIDSIR